MTVQSLSRGGGFDDAPELPFPTLTHQYAEQSGQDDAANIAGNTVAPAPAPAPAPALDTGNNVSVITAEPDLDALGVRMLLPLECERIQGWPDNWTATGIDPKGRAYALSDSARYKLCGNGWGNEWGEWIFRRLVAAVTPCP